MRGKELLTNEQRQSFMDLNELSDWELAAYHTFSARDMAVIARHRRDDTRLGFAVQLALLRYPGWPFLAFPQIPEKIILHAAQQIQVDPQFWTAYAVRENTVWDHIKEIRETYEYQPFSIQAYRGLFKRLTKQALENDHALDLVQSGLSMLRQEKIILPAMTTIERAAWNARRHAEDTIFNHIHLLLTDVQKQALNGLLEPSRDGNKTTLSWLKESSGRTSPEAFLQVIERLETVRSLALPNDLSTIHPNRLRQLAKIGARYEPFALRRFSDPKKYAILVIYLRELIQDLIDQAFEIHHRQMIALQSKGRKGQEELQQQNGKSINTMVVAFAELGAALIQARENKTDPFQMVEKVMPWDQLITAVETAQKLSRPIDYDYLDLIEGRYSYLRKYTPALLSNIEFHATPSAKPIMDAVHTVQEMNASGKRKLSDDAPTSFLPQRWRKYVIGSDGTINRSYYEMAALTELRNAVRAGNVSIVGSRQHKDFEEYLVSKIEWESAKETGDTGLPVSSSVDEYLAERIETLTQHLNFLSEHIDELDGVSLVDGSLHVDRLDADTPETAKKLSRTLYGMIPRIKLTDLLLEVSHWTEFDQQLIHSSTGKSPSTEEKSVTMATLMAMGTNIGLTKMAEAAPGISYRQMAHAAQWRMDEDTLRRAQASLVNFHHRLPLASAWGDGTTSSSDGMRMPIRVSSLHADANPHYGFGKGATIYRFTSDQGTSFNVQVITTNSRDAIHVIDGILHHETDLQIEEHYTDTAGYTDQIFGLTHLLGFRFAPRLRDVDDARFYTFGKSDDFPKISALLRGQINMKVIRENYNDVLRVAHSIRRGTVPGALIMGKLGSYARQNSLAKALSEMGRIEKTIFLVDYLSNEALRRRIQKGLNKGEAMNALARAIFFGKQGEFRERTLQDQLQRASTLNILINAISVWNTVYLTEATNFLKANGNLDETLLSHISPLGWEHINFLGEYNFDDNQVSTSERLRPLRLGDSN